MTIASALDKLNDKLAGSDQEASQTIEGMILRIIDNIDAGGGGSIPVASADTLGGIKVGDNLSITEGGVLSASGGGGGLVVHDTDGTLDKTYAEIATAAQVGAVILSQPHYEDPNATICTILNTYGQIENVGYAVTFDSYTYVSETEDGYPVAAD